MPSGSASKSVALWYAKIGAQLSSQLCGKSSSAPTQRCSGGSVRSTVNVGGTAVPDARRSSSAAIDVLSPPATIIVSPVELFRFGFAN